MSTVSIFDGHNDMLLRLRGGGTFLTRDGRGHIDLPRAREGGLVGGFCSVFASSRGDPLKPFAQGRFPRTPSLVTARRQTLELIAVIVRLERESQGALSIVRTVGDIERVMAAGGFAALMHIEGAEAIDPDLFALEVFWAAGLRSVDPVWSRPNAFGHGVPIRFPGNPDCGPGLTEEGRRLVRACNELRIVVDLSHITEAGFWEVAGLTDAPLVATHSNAHALFPHHRNLTDRQLDAIRDSDGIVGVNFAVDFLRPDGVRDPDTPISRLAEHFDYLIDRMGIEHVGFGSDFDGATIPQEIGDASGLPKVIEALRSRGYAGAELDKLAYTNWLRVT